MSLEATMILLDNSDFARNGDFLPTRWEAQKDSVSLIQNAKFAAHPESAVGVGLMGLRQVEILVTPQTESGRIMSALHGIKLGGSIHLGAALQISQLALKHRQNKVQRQRIIAFVASPVIETQEQLILLAKKLKKNGVAVDIINMGESGADHQEKLLKFIENINKDDNSHYVNIAPGINFVSDQLMESPILGANRDQAGGARIDQELGIDPNTDPELAMALRISLEEEKERIRRLEQQNQVQPNAQKEESKMQEEKVVDDQHPDLKRDDDNEEEFDEEELMKRAMELSLQDMNKEEQEKEQESKQQDQPQDFSDTGFVNELLSLLPGVDSKQTMELLQNLEKKDDEKKKQDEKKNQDDQK